MSRIPRSTKTAQYEPGGEVYGRLLYWDSTYHKFSMVDTREAEMRVHELGAFKNAVLVLQHEHGLTLSQANEAALTAFGAFNEGVNLDIIQRIAQVEEGPDEQTVDMVSRVATRLGEGEPIDDEAIVGEAIHLGRLSTRIGDLLDNGMTGFRFDLPGLDSAGRQAIGQQIVGMRKMAESLYALLSEGFDPEGTACGSTTGTSR